MKYYGYAFLIVLGIIIGAILPANLIWDAFYKSTGDGYYLPRAVPIAWKAWTGAVWFALAIVLLIGSMLKYGL